MKYPVTTQDEIREMFWECYPEFNEHYKRSKKQNDYNCEIRTAFCDYVDILRRDEIISEKLANRAIL